MPRPGSRNTLTPRNVTYTRTTPNGVQTVNSIVHTAPERQPAHRDTQSNVENNTATPQADPPELPPGHRFASFVSDNGKANIQSFIKRHYGPGSERLEFPENTRFHGIVGPDNRIKAAGEVKRMNWSLSELGHLTVDPEVRNMGLGRKMLQYLEQKTKTPMAMITSKNPSVMKMSEEMGFSKMGVVPGPSGDAVHVYNKVLKSV